MSATLIASLFSWTDAAGATQTLDVDVVMQASDKRSAKLTDHVVETGSVITDHVVIQPESLSMDLVVSQTPITVGEGRSLQQLSIDSTAQALSAKVYPLAVRDSEFQPGGFLLLSQGLRTVVTGAANTLLGAVGLGAGADKLTGSDVQLPQTTSQARTLQATSATDRVTSVHDQLIAIMNGKLLVTVSFKGRLYIDYLLTEIELSHQAGKFGQGSFKVQARAFRTVTGVAAQLPLPADFRAKANAKKGNKAGKTPDPTPKPKPKTFGARGFDAFMASPFGKAMFGDQGI